MNEYEKLLQEITVQEERLFLNISNHLERLLSMYKELELSVERDGFGEEWEELRHFKLNLETLTDAYQMMERGKQRDGRARGDDFSGIVEWMEGMRIFCMTYEQRMRGNKELLEALEEAKGAKDVRMGDVYASPQRTGRGSFFEGEDAYPFIHSVSEDDCEDYTMHAVYNAPEIGAGAEAFAALDGRTREEEPPMACVYASPGLMGRRRRGLFSRIFKREP